MIQCRFVKGLGIKNSLPMQLLPTRGLTGLSANRLPEYKVQSSSEGDRIWTYSS
jgi:hypothetical protein